MLTLIVFKVDLSIYAFVGLMMLIGIVKKNAIMQIDCALEVERRTERVRPRRFTRVSDPLPAHYDDYYVGAARRFAMSFGYGSGGEARRPLGLAVVGGLSFRN